MPEDPKNKLAASLANKVSQSGAQTADSTPQATTEEGKTATEVKGEQEVKAASDSGIQVGASTGGSRVSGSPPAGYVARKLAPGYYSRHAGKMIVGSKKYPWPMEAPLVPEEVTSSKEECEALTKELDSMVERKLAHLVKE